MPIILVVDDDPSVRALLALALEDVGEIVTAADGDEAAACVAASRPDIAVLDIGLPGTDGMSLLGRWRQDPATADLPIIMLTGDEDGRSRVNGYRTGADAYLTKPFEPESLVSLVGTLLAREPDDHNDLMHVLQGLAKLE